MSPQRRHDHEGAAPPALGELALAATARSAKVSSSSTAFASGCLALAALLLMAGCAQQPHAPQPVEAPPAAPASPPAPLPAAPEPTTAPQSVVELSSRPGEQALLAGLRAYDDGQYQVAEQKLGTALTAGLAAPKDRAAAHKTLAFLYCTSKRLKPCEAEFRAAQVADPRFALSKAEAGHPLWGPVYRRTLGAR
ncbi:TssQ family T6SS-associated lipoprotein [Methylibium sp.]|uniref:TssQ family T6SS-associated lipoprotein n=1 Tax=Methylibium sp. TaxID=2067992 RepID=UPI00286C3214|nr:TssQ family T6SS-associated lipoprotein [Methylibium sp.]